LPLPLPLPMPGVVLTGGEPASLALLLVLPDAELCDDADAAILLWAACSVLNVAGDVRSIPTTAPCASTK